MQLEQPLLQSFANLQKKKSVCYNFALLSDTTGASFLFWLEKILIFPS